MMPWTASVDQAGVDTLATGWTGAGAERIVTGTGMTDAKATDLVADMVVGVGSC